MNHPFLCRSVLGVVHFTFIISALVNLTNMFGNCFNGTDKKSEAQIPVGVCSVVWLIHVTTLSDR
jgi:hypothetical protein